MKDLILRDMDDWDKFADTNREELIELCGDLESALTKTRQGGLVIAPTFVSFAD